MKKSNNTNHRSKQESGFYEPSEVASRKKGERKNVPNNTNHTPAAQYLSPNISNYMNRGDDDEDEDGDEEPIYNNSDRSKYKSIFTNSTGQNKHQYLKTPQSVDPDTSEEENVMSPQRTINSAHRTKKQIINENSDEDDEPQKEVSQVIELESDTDPEAEEIDDNDEEEDEDANNNEMEKGEPIRNDRSNSNSSDIVVTSCDYTTFQKELEEISVIKEKCKKCIEF